MSKDKTNPKYLKNPKIHYIDLCRFRDRINFLLLGEQEKEWRGQLEWLLGRTNNKIREIGRKLL